MAAQNLKPAKNTRPHHGVAGPAHSTNPYTINWYQQTWHTIEFSNNRHIRILAETIHFNEFFISFFFAAMFTAYFIHFHFANPRFSSEFHFMERIRPAELKQFPLCAPSA
ncbi:hypothetical protein [Arthrobacter sp. LAR12-1-1.1]|uniref:hypothetical protein n=1 Tax=Arthrobacter sp. LAR12-1-1.1 TaxID=3135215 RepID=UPI0034350E8A